MNFKKIRFVFYAFYLYNAGFCPSNSSRILHFRVPLLKKKISSAVFCVSFVSFLRQSQKKTTSCLLWPNAPDQAFRQFLKRLASIIVEKDVSVENCVQVFNVTTLGTFEKYVTPKGKRDQMWCDKVWQASSEKKFFTRFNRLGGS